MTITHYSITPKGQDVPPGHLKFHRVAVKSPGARKKVVCWVADQIEKGRWPEGVYIQRIRARYAPHEPKFDGKEVYEYPKEE